MAAAMTIQRAAVEQGRDMIRIITSRNIAACAHYVAAFSALRHRVFVERLGWEIPSSGATKGFEYDQFDTSEAVYMVVCNEADVVVAGLRLLKTTQPSLLAACFPDLAEGEVPRSETIWEVTRFVVDPCPVRTAGCQSLATQLVWGLQSYGLMTGMSSFVSVSYIGMERLLRSAGCRFRRLGSPRDVGGRKTVALVFDIAEDILARVEGSLIAPAIAPRSATVEAVIAADAGRPSRPVLVT
jgi:N-acyl-L-homoserine lactone synthetase